MKLSRNIDLGKSLRHLFGDGPGSSQQIELDRSRQNATVNAILSRYFHKNTAQRRELTILADEVGLGKTYVALAVAVSILDAIRNGQYPTEHRAAKPIVLILTPPNEALFNKWLREAAAFKVDCASTVGALDWMSIDTPITNSSKSGNLSDLAKKIQTASQSKPLLLIAKQSVFGASLGQNDNIWRRRALAIIFEQFPSSRPYRRTWCKHILGTSKKAKSPNC